jgi:hypothetical protein
MLRKYLRAAWVIVDFFCHLERELLSDLPTKIEEESRT